MNSNDHTLPTLDILRSRVRAGLSTYLQARANIIALSELDTLIALGWCDEQTAITIRLELASAAVAIPLPGAIHDPGLALATPPRERPAALPAGHAQPADVPPGKKRCPYPGCTTLIGSASAGCRKHVWKLRKAKSQTKAILAAKGRPPADLDLDDEDEIDEDRD